MQKRHRGQGMTAYIVMTALVAVAAAGVYQYYGQTVRAQSSGIALEISGQNADQAIATAQDGAFKALGEADSKCLDSYGVGMKGGCNGSGGSTASATGTPGSSGSGFAADNGSAGGEQNKDTGGWFGGFL